MTPKPQLSRIAEAGIQELRRDHGIEPTLDEIIWLHELGKAQEAAGRIDGILEGPAQAGNAFLWPMTIMAAQWFRNNANKWFGTSPLFTMYALAFALAHGRGQALPDTTKRSWSERIVRRMLDIRDQRTLADLQDRVEAIDAINAWINTAGATKPEIEAAIDFLLPKQETISDEKRNDPPTQPGVNYDDIIHELAALSGTDPEYWRSRTSKDATIRAYINVITIEQARRGQAGPPIRDALGDAIHNFRKAISAIIKAHKPAPEVVE